jgi:hypothetical protein
MPPRPSGARVGKRGVRAGVARFSLRGYEDQATASVVLSICSLVCLIPLAWMVFRHFDLGQRWIWYNPKTARLQARPYQWVKFENVALEPGGGGQLEGEMDRGEKDSAPGTQASGKAI